jgi:hypothetical protein
MPHTKKGLCKEQVRKAMRLRESQKLRKGNKTLDSTLEQPLQACELVTSVFVDCEKYRKRRVKFKVQPRKLIPGIGYPAVTIHCIVCIVVLFLCSVSILHSVTARGRGSSKQMSQSCPK